MSHCRGIAALLALGLAASACAAASQADLVEARASYERCVAEQGARRCKTERERLETIERRYEDEDRPGWDCEPDHEDCPVQR